MLDNIIQLCRSNSNHAMIHRSNEYHRVAVNSNSDNIKKQVKSHLHQTVLMSCITAVQTHTQTQTAVIISCYNWLWTAKVSNNNNSRLTALCPVLPRWACTRKVKPIWILLKQETVSGSGISRAICQSARRSRQITTPAPHHSVFYRPDALPATQPTASKHWRQS